MPRMMLLVALALMLAGCQAAPSEKDVDINLLFFQHRRSKQAGADVLIPLYSYDYDVERQEREFTFFPLMTGFTVSPTNEYWFSLPMLTVFGGSRSQDAERSYFASLGLLTFSSSEVSPHLEQHEFVALPLLARSSRRVYRGSRGSVTWETWTAPFPLISTERITREIKGAPEQKLEIQKRSILTLPMGGEDRFSIADLNHWGRDRQVQLLNLFNFSLFEFARFQGRYPGSRYVKAAATTAASADQKLTPKQSDELPIVSQFNIFGPMLSFRTDVRTETRWEFLPLFHYRRKGPDTSFRILPLMFELRNGSPRFSPLGSLSKLWPLLYHDEYKRRWDILWPLAYYRDDEVEDRTEMRVRLLFRYYQKEDYRELSLLDGLLYSHQATDEKSNSSVLLGYLFSAETNEAESSYRWDILRGLLFGMSQRKGETPTYQFFFIRLGGKKIEQKAAETKKGS